MFYHDEPTTSALYVGRDFVELFISHELEIEKNSNKHDIYELTITDTHITDFTMNSDVAR